MSRGSESIFDSSEEAALSLEVMAKGIVEVDECPHKMRTGVSKIMLEVSGKVLFDDVENEAEITKGDPELENRKVIQAKFNTDKTKEHEESRNKKSEDESGKKEKWEPGA